LAWETSEDQGFLWQSLDIELQTASRVSELDDASLMPREVAAAKQFLVVVEEEDKDDKGSSNAGINTGAPPAPSSTPGAPSKPKRRLR
jgi:hypothetical protein